MKNGIYWNGVLNFYKNITLDFFLYDLIFFNKIFYKFLFQKFELQLNCYKLKFWEVSEYYLKIINKEFLKKLPPFKKIQQLKNINVVRYFLIKSYRGKCLFVGKPSKGQRTWSNANNSKNTVKILKLFKKKKLKLDFSWD